MSEALATVLSPRGTNSNIVQVGATTYIKYTDAKKAVYFYVKGRETEKKHRWKQFFDPNRNKYYYSNLEHKKTVWYLPDVEKEEGNIKSPLKAEPKKEIPSPIDESKEQKQVEPTNTEASKIEAMEEPIVGLPKIDPPTEIHPLKEEQKTESPRETVTELQEKETDENEGKEDEGGSLLNSTIWGYMAGRKSFSASFAENNSPSDSSAFDGFDFTSKETPLNSPKMRMTASDSEEESVPAFSGKLTRSNTIPNQNVTVELIKFSKKDLIAGRGKLESCMEQELFRGVGLGEVHVLGAIKAYYFKKVEAKKELAVGIARDYSGAFGLFFAHFSQKKGRKFSSIAFDIPMLHFYEMSPTVTDKDNVRFNLSIDGSEFDLMTHTILRDKLRRGLEFVYKLVRAKKGKELCLYRMSSVDFAVTYTVQRPIHTRESFLRELVTLIQRTKHPEQPNTDLDELFLDLRILIRNGDDREWIIEQLSAFTRSRDFKPRHVVVCAQILDVVLKTPSPVGNFQTERAELQRNLIQNMIHIWSKLKALDDSLIVQLREETEDIFSVMRSIWKSRGNLPDVKFPDDFFVAETIDSKKKLAEDKLKTIQDRKFRESLIVKSMEEGVFLACIFYTPSGEVLSDMKDNLPCVQLSKLHYSEARDITIDSEDRIMEWMMRLGFSNFSQILSEIEISQNIRRKVPTNDPLRRNTISETNEAKEAFVNSRFKKAMARACLELTSLFNIGSLGNLFDKPIKMRGTNVVMFVAVRKLDDKRAITVPSLYKWSNNFEFEHHLYQKYEGIHELLPMERLGDHYTGSRWLTSAVKNDRYLRHKLRQGLYIGFMCYSTSFTGYDVLVTEERRFMLPHSFVGKILPTEEQWIWIQSLRCTIDERKSLLGDDRDTSGINAFSPDYELYENSSIPTFELLFYRALLQLQNQLGIASVQDLGTLYDLELITLDEIGKTKMVLFVKHIEPFSQIDWTIIRQTSDLEEEKSHDEDEVKRKKRRKTKKSLPYRNSSPFLWRRGELFEVMMLQVFKPVIYHSYMKKYINNLSCDIRWTNNSIGFVTDEAIRLVAKKDECKALVDEVDLLSFVKQEESWLTVRWPIRVINWMDKLLGVSIIDTCSSLVESSKKIEEEEKARVLEKMKDKTKFRGAVLEANIIRASYYKIPKLERLISEEITKSEHNSFDWNIVEEKLMAETMLEKSNELDKGDVVTEQVTNVPFLDDEEDLEKTICCMYDVDVNIEEVKDIESLKFNPTKEEITDIVTQEMFEKSILRSFDESELKVIEIVMNEIVDMLEVSDELLQITVSGDRFQESLIILNRERTRYQQSILDAYNRVLEEEMGTYDHERLKKRLTTDRDMHSVLFEQMSELDSSYEDIIRRMVIQYDNTMKYAKQTFQVINSALETVELSESMYLYERTLENQERLKCMIEEQHNFIPRNDLSMIGVTRKERRFLTSNGSKMIDFREDSDFSFCQLGDTEEDIEFEQERIKALIKKQVEMDVEREKCSRSAMKSSLAKSLFGYQGFSLPRSVPELPTPQMKSIDRHSSSISSPLFSKSSKNTKTRLPGESSTLELGQPRDDWFGYKPPEPMSMTVKRQLESIREAREKHQTELRKQGFFSEQSKAVLNLNQLIDMYSTLKVKSSRFLTEDQQPARNFRRTPSRVQSPRPQPQANKFKSVINVAQMSELLSGPSHPFRKRSNSRSSNSFNSTNQ